MPKSFDAKNIKNHAVNIFHKKSKFAALCYEPTFFYIKNRFSISYFKNGHLFLSNFSERHQFFSGKK